MRENDQPDQSHRQHPNDDNDDAEQPLATHDGQSTTTG
jgi:hypothetical protein